MRTNKAAKRSNALRTDSDHLLSTLLHYTSRVLSSERKMQGLTTMKHILIPKALDGFRNELTLRGTPAVHLHPAKPPRVPKYTSSVFRANLNCWMCRSLSLRTTCFFLYINKIGSRKGSEGSTGTCNCPAFDPSGLRATMWSKQGARTGARRSRSVRDNE